MYTICNCDYFTYGGKLMGNLFNPDNKVMIALGHVADYIILSLIWTICSLPIVTIGSS